MFDILTQINSYQKLAPEYGAKMLTNHLPMALFALHKLGGNNTDLDRFTKSYIGSHPLYTVPSAAGVTLSDENWKEHLGKRKHFSSFKIFLGEKLEEKGREQFLKDYFNPLIPGISAAAFHSLIRLAYGVTSRNEQEIISGMAYLADAYLELQAPLPEVSDNVSSLREGFNFISEQLSSGELSLPSITGVIFQKMDTVSRLEIFTYSSSKVALPRAMKLKDISEVMLDIYLSTKNFTALHMLTSCHASRIMMPYVKNETYFLKYLLQAILSAYLTIKSPYIKEHKPIVLGMDESFIQNIKAEGRQSNDDHDIKLTFSILEESRTYNNPLYMNAAVLMYPELSKHIMISTAIGGGIKYE